MKSGETAVDILVTVRDWLRYAVSRFNQAGLFFGHGSDNAYDEAAYLLLHTLHLPLDRLEPFLDARLLAHERQALDIVLTRRADERIPAAYLTRQAWLGDFKFYVDERVLIPRSFIAEILRESLAPWISDPDEVTAVLDLCTGSGCLAIMAAAAFHRAHVDAADVSRDALAVAKFNVDHYGLTQRVSLHPSDMFSGLAGARYDLILCNPPYVDAASMTALPSEYLHEPQLALAGGKDGLDFVRTLITQAPSHLNKNGLLVVEIGHNKEAMEAAFPGLAATWIETSGEDHFVFLVSREQLVATH